MLHIFELIPGNSSLGFKEEYHLSKLSLYYNLLFLNFRYIFILIEEFVLNMAFRKGLNLTFYGFCPLSNYFQPKFVLMSLHN